MLFSDANLLASHAARRDNKRVKAEEERERREEVERAQQNSMRRMTVSMRNPDKAALKFARHGMLVIQCTEQEHFSVDVASIASTCIELETRICARLRHLNVRFSGFSEMRKRDVAALLDDERQHSFKFSEVSSRCLGRLDIKLPAEVVQQHFSNQDAPWLSAVRAILGGEQDCHLAYCGLISSFPGSFSQPFHGDGPHLFGSSLQLPPHAVNVFVPLHAITEELGPTEFFPGSHKIDTATAIGRALATFSSLTQASSLKILENCMQIGKVPVQPLLQPNRDILLYDYRTVHRGTSNKSLNTTRRMLYLLYTKSWFRDHINFGESSIFDDGASAALEAQREVNVSSTGSCPGHEHL